MTNLYARLDTLSPAVISLFRVVAGLLFTVHGTVKLFGWPGDSAGATIGAWPMWWAGIIELVAGLLITVGLFTRPAAFLTSGMMAVAYFWMHQPKGLWPIENGGDAPLLFCFGFLLLVFTGGGSYALDATLDRRTAAVPG